MFSVNLGSNSFSKESLFFKPFLFVILLLLLSELYPFLNPLSSIRSSSSINFDNIFFRLFSLIFLFLISG